MGWSGNATIGFKAAGSYYENHMFSGNSARLIACLNSSSNYSWSNIIYQLSKLSYIVHYQKKPLITYISALIVRTSIDQKDLPFFTLGSTSGVMKTFFPSLDDTSSDAIYIPGGFKFGENNHTTVYVRRSSYDRYQNPDINNYCTCVLQVSSNGFFSFDREASYNTPQLFSSSFTSAHLVAPFWSNNDISNRVGNISYEVHYSETSNSNYIDLVSTFISQQEQVEFRGSWMLLAEWNRVPQFRGPLTVVS